jgi:hypothetical protein
MLTTRHQEFLSEWLCQRIGYVPSPLMKCLGSVDSTDTILRGVVGYDGYNGASVVMHMAGEPGWIDKAILHAAFDYPFNVMGCSQVLAFVPSGNDVALQMNRRLGFEVVIELDGAHPDGSLFVMRMKRDNCKWLSPRRTH